MQTPAMRLIGGILTVLVLAVPALAHHILGIPHYAYDEEYPQTPILTYRVDAGPHEIEMTGYPGIPQPGEPCALHVYIRRIDNGTPYDATVTLTVYHDRFLGHDDITYGPVEAGLDFNVYKFYPVFPEEANYTVRISFDAEGAPYILDLPMVVGEPGSPWMVLGGIGFGLFGFLVVIRAIRIKRRRQRWRMCRVHPVSEPAPVN